MSIAKLIKYNSIFLSIDINNSAIISQITRCERNSKYFDMFVIGCNFLDLDMLTNIKNIFTIIINNKTCVLKYINDQITNIKIIKLALLELFLLYDNVINNYENYSFISVLNPSKYNKIANNLIDLVKILGLPYLNYAYDLENYYHYKSKSILTNHDTAVLYDSNIRNDYKNMQSYLELNEVGILFDPVISDTKLYPYSETCTVCKNTNRIENGAFIDVLYDDSQKYDLLNYKVIHIKNFDIIVPNNDTLIPDYMALSYMLFNLLTLEMHITCKINHFNDTRLINFVSPINLINFVLKYANIELPLNNKDLNLIQKYTKYYYDILLNEKLPIEELNAYINKKHPDFDLNELLFIFNENFHIIKDVYRRFSLVMTYRYDYMTDRYLCMSTDIDEDSFDPSDDIITLEEDDE